MIIITGAAGFMASHFCKRLNLHEINDIILVDDFTQEKKRKNWENLKYVDKIQRDHFFLWAEQNVQHIHYIFHLGARTDNSSAYPDIFEVLNVDFSQRIWSFATTKRVPLIYATSYLTNNIDHLSLFAKSKYIFDQWINKQQQAPPFWAGLKFFQVYGKNEESKGNEASMVYKIYRNCEENSGFIRVEKNIMQDYIYVNDVSKVLYYFLNHAPPSGVYEVGSGFARPLQTIVDVMNKVVNPKQKLVLAYQQEDSFIFQANMALLRKYAYKQSFLPLEKGIKSMFRKHP